MVKLILLTILITANYNNAEKILGVFHYPSKSHHILGTALMNALAKKGHNVTLISPFPVKPSNRNYQLMELTGMLEFTSSMSMQKTLARDNELSILGQIQTMHGYISKLENFALNHPVIKTLASSSTKYDVVIMVYFGNDAFLGLANKLDAESVIFSPLGNSIFTNKISQVPSPYSYVPNKFFPVSDKMNFWQRLINSITDVAYTAYSEFIYMSVQKSLLDKHFPRAPDIQHLRENVSLILLNSHFSSETPRSHFPNMIQVGGLHISENNELSKEYKDYMDSAKHGVILFTLGSNIKSADLSTETLNAIISTFAKLPQKILWKFETEVNFTNFPPNVKVSKWLPQSAILAHPNLLLFITHGGALSVTEAIYYGIPMVTIPFFGDQRSNAVDAANHGYARNIEHTELTEEALGAAVGEVLNNPMYRNNVKKISRIIRDRPIKPLDNAVFWIEHVLRHRGSHHFKFAVLKLKWYQYYFFDVFGLLLGIIVGLLICMYSLWKVFKIFFFGAQKHLKDKIKTKAS